MLKRIPTDRVRAVRIAPALALLSLSIVLVWQIPGVSAAGENGEFKRRVYAGAGIIGSRLAPEADELGRSVGDRTSTGGSLTLGYDLLPRLSLEGHLADLGEAELQPDGSVNYKVGGLDLLLYGLNSADARRLREGFSLFGRLGLGAMDASSSLPVERVNQYSLLTGLGVEYGFDSGLGLRAEFVSHDSDARYAQVGLIYRFGSAELTPGGDGLQRSPAANDPDSLALPGRNSAREPVDTDGDDVPNVRDDCPASSNDTVVDEAGCDALDRASGRVDFRFDSASLTDSARSSLADVIKVMQQLPSSKIVIDAHTDNVGDSLTNLQLAAGRAISVARYLIDEGIDAQRLQPRAFGESQPRASNATPEGRAANRRVEFRLQ